jgi:CheY-like chemotaxis protein
MGTHLAAEHLWPGLLNLPAMDRRHLAHSLRQSFGPDIRLIALTSRDDPEDRARSAAAALTAENRPLTSTAIGFAG